MNKTHSNATGRREFLGAVTTGAAAMTLAGLFAPLQRANANSVAAHNEMNDDDWFNKIKGKHRIVFDATRPHEVMPFAWPRVFLMTNEMTGTAAKDCSVVVVLRHDAIPYAMNSKLWEKYKFGEVFKAEDPKSKQPSVRNPFWEPAKGDFAIPGFGEVQIGINELQQNGVMFCVCNAAMTVYSAALAEGMKANAKEILNEWTAGVLPGIQIVPSGVWALGRAQEHGCSYCFAG